MKKATFITAVILSAITSLATLPELPGDPGGGNTNQVSGTFTNYPVVSADFMFTWTRSNGVGHLTFTDVPTTNEVSIFAGWCADTYMFDWSTDTWYDTGTNRMFMVIAPTVDDLCNRTNWIRWSDWYPGSFEWLRDENVLTCEEPVFNVTTNVYTVP